MENDILKSTVSTNGKLFDCGCRKWLITTGDEIIEVADNKHVCDHKCAKIEVYRVYLGFKRFYIMKEPKEPK